LITSGTHPVTACIAQVLIDDPEMLATIHELSASVF